MTKENGAAPDAKGLKQPQLRILAQFIRDLSFENVASQREGEVNVQPNINLQVNIDAKKRSAENQYEVTNKLTVNNKAKDDSQILFILELEYVGLFLIKDVPEDQLRPLLMIECPRLLFPFVRRIISDVTRDGGFPPLNIDNIDFLSIYHAEMAQLQKAGAEANETK